MSGEAAPPLGSFLRFSLILGALTALGPIAIDMYLPGLPLLVRELGTSEGAAQFSVMSFFAGLTSGQLFYGPLSDKIGRKPPIYIGLGLFIAGAIGCAFAPGIVPLIAFRFLQGAGGCIGMTIGSAVTRDLHTGVAAVRLLSTIILVLGLSPILAPLAGSFILAVGSWRLIFVVHAIFGLLCIGMVYRFMPETRPVEARALTRLGNAFAIYAGLLKDARFMSTVLVSALVQAGFFAYLAGSAFVFISVYHLSPTAFSILFSVNAVGLIGGTQLNAPLIRRFGAPRIVMTATAVCATAAFLLCALSLFHLDTLPVLSALLFVCIGCLGFVQAPSNMMALAPLGANAGTASALMGTLQFGCGAAASAVVGIAADGTTMPMVAVIAACSIGAFALCTQTRRQRLA